MIPKVNVKKMGGDYVVKFSIGVQGFTLNTPLCGWSKDVAQWMANRLKDAFKTLENETKKKI